MYFFYSLEIIKKESTEEKEKKIVSETGSRI